MDCPFCLYHETNRARVKSLLRLINRRLQLVGLDAAGKTTILYRLKLGEIVTTIPSIGFNVESLTHDGIEITSWDLGGRGGNRVIARKHLIPSADAIVFIVDSTDRERLQEARDDFYAVMKDNPVSPSAPLLVLANKQDCVNVLKVEEIAAAFDLETLMKSRECTIMGASATEDRGLWDAMGWVCAAIRRARASETYIAPLPLTFT